MNRESGLSQALFAAVVAITLGTAANVSAQSNNTAADDAAATSSAAEQPRRERNRRRNADTADERTAAEAATAADAAPAATPAAIADTDETVEETIVCKNIKLTGSKVARRICGTPEQWAAMGKRTNDAAEETMRQARDRQSTITQQPTPALGQ